MKPEARLSKDVRDVLNQLGCIVYSTEQGVRMGRGGTRCTPGIADLIVFAPNQERACFAELKAGKRRTTRAQDGFLEVARQCGVDAVVWRAPEDAVRWWKEGR